MKNLTFTGNKDILNRHKTAFFCSQKCPPEIILKSIDKAIEWREKGICIISGFHTPVEKDVLHYLLKGDQPIILCPARSLEKFKIKCEIKKEVDNGKVLLISNLTNKRISRKYSDERNIFIVNLADEIFIAYAHKCGLTEKIYDYAKSLSKKISFINNKMDKSISSS